MKSVGEIVAKHVDQRHSVLWREPYRQPLGALDRIEGFLRTTRPKIQYDQFAELTAPCLDHRHQFRSMAFGERHESLRRRRFQITGGNNVVPRKPCLDVHQPAFGVEAAAEL